MEKKEILRGSNLFSLLNDNELQELSKLAIEKTYPKNTVIIHEGDVSTSFYLVLSGKAIAIRSNEAGRQIILNVFRKGDYFGEMSFIDGEPRSATVMTKEKTNLLIIRGDKFGKFFMSEPDRMFNLMKELLRKLRIATKQIEELAFDDVYERIARLLRRFSKPGADGKRIIEYKLTRQEIADMVGSTREMVSRIMSELTKGGYISKKNGLIVIEKELPEKF